MLPQHEKKRNEHPEELLSGILFKKPKATITNDLKSLKKLTKSEVTELLKKEIPLDDDDLSKIGNLKGLHLSTAIDAYADEFKDTNSIVKSKQIMIASLMKQDKITDESVAEFVANWLIEQFIRRKIINL